MRLPDAYSVLMPFQKNADKQLKLKWTGGLKATVFILLVAIMCEQKYSQACAPWVPLGPREKASVFFFWTPFPGIPVDLTGHQFQNMTVLVTKAKFVGNKAIFYTFEA